MVKKSRKAAARYSQLSKAGKKKRRPQAASVVETPAVPETHEIAAPKPAKQDAPKPAQKVQPATRRAKIGYQYVRDDLRRIGILSGVVIVILIVLSFILG